MKLDDNALRVNQLVDIYLTRSLRGSRFKSRIEEINENNLVLAMPFDKGFPVRVETGATIHVKIVAESSPYIFDCAVIEKKMTPLPVWIVSLPKKLIKVQQREFVRIDVKLYATISSTDSDSDEDIQQNKFLINDISGGGLRFVSSTTFPIGKNLLLTFELPDRDLIEISGQIVRVEQPQPDRDIYWIGVKYIGISEQKRNKIVKYIFQKQLERRRRGY